MGIAALALLGCDGGPVGPDAGTDAATVDGGSRADAGDAGSGGEVTRARVGPAGGSLAAPDGIFRLIVPPGALLEETELMLRVLPSAEWPEETSGAAPLAGVYELGPEGLAFEVPAFAVHRFASRPAELAGDDGELPLAIHLSRAADGTLEAVDTTTAYGEAGVAVIGELAHLSVHWTVSPTPFPGGRWAFSVEMPTHDHEVGSTLAPISVHINADETADIGEVGMSAYSTHAEVWAPIAHPGWGPATQPSLPDLIAELFGVSPMGPMARQSPTIPVDLGRSALPPPHPSFACLRAGEATLNVSGWVSTRTFGGSDHKYLTAAYVATVPCAERTPARYGEGLYGQLRDLVRFGRGLQPRGASGAALNLGLIRDAAARGIVLETEPSGVETASYPEDTDFSSVEGPAQVEIFHNYVPPGATHSPTFRASWDADTSRYVFEALTALGAVPWHVPIWYRWPGGGTTSSLGTLGRPDIPTCAGLATAVEVPEGAADHLFVQATRVCSAERSVLEATIDLDLFPATDGTHTIPLLTDAQIAALSAPECALESVRVATVSCATTGTLFPDASDYPLCSADMLRADAALLDPVAGAGPCGSPADTASDATHRAAIGDLDRTLCDLVAGAAHPFATTGVAFRDDGSDYQARITYRNLSDTYAPIVSSHGVVSGTPSFGYNINGVPLGEDVEVRVQLSVIFPGQPDLVIGFRRDGSVYAVSRYDRVPAGG